MSRRYGDDEIASIEKRFNAMVQVMGEDGYHSGRDIKYLVEIIAQLRADLKAAREWRPIETAPKDGTLMDMWCVPPEGSDFPHGIRLTDCSWHNADDVFNHTGWMRVLDDGNYDLVDGPPSNTLGLPRWVPTHWQPRPAAPEPMKEG
jgi:hypothetical protein